VSKKKLCTWKKRDRDLQLISTRHLKYAACCRDAYKLVCWYDGKGFVIDQDVGGPGMTYEDCLFSIKFCPFCGSKIDTDTPVKDLTQILAIRRKTNDTDTPVRG